MAKKQSNTPSKTGSKISRRGFIGASVVGGATTVLAPTALGNTGKPSTDSLAKSTPPSDAQMEREVGSSMPPEPIHNVKQAATGIKRPGD